MHICKICNKKFNSHIPSAFHLTKMHNMTIKDYYDKFYKKENEGICPVCGKSTKFIRFVEGYRVFCSSKCAANYLETIEKRKATNFKKMGVCFPLQNESIKNKTKNTILEKYGVENPSQIQDVKDKKIKTTLEHYGVINPFNIDSVKEKCRIKTKIKGKHKKFYFKKYSSLYKTGKIIDFNNGLITIKCNNCNNTSTMDQHLFFLRLKRGHNPCLNCNKLTHPISHKEEELYSIIKEQYHGIIKRNNRKIIPPQELDFYLPDINLAIEFNGTYWHADKRFYNATDKLVHGTAQYIWERDENKQIECNKRGIRLISIAEYDFDIDKENIIKLLLKEIKNMDNNWQQISLLEAKFFTQSGKFQAVQEIDPFAMEEQKFLLKENNNIRFKFKMVMSDPAKYYIYPIVDGNPVTVEKLKEVAGITEI